MLAVVEIAIVLCSVFLVAIPAIAADQSQEMQKVSASTITTASEDDYVLGVYGNANEDDTIDMRDLTYVKLIFFGKKSETELADAKYDGKINPLDFIQIKLIIVGKEKELTIVDEGERIVTVSKPIERIAINNPEIYKVLKAEDRVVAVSKYTKKRTIFYPELSKLPAPIGSDDKTMDYELLYELNPDIFVTYYPSSSGLPDFLGIVDKLEMAGIKVLCLPGYKPDDIVENTKKIGYILDRKDEADEFIDWYEGHMNTIKEQVETISEEDKPRVYFEYFRDYKTCSRGPGICDLIPMAGGKNIAADLYPPKYPAVESEWVLRENPEVIVHATYSGYVSCGYEEDDPTEMELKRDAIRNRPGFDHVTAVETGRVYVCTYSIAESVHHFVGLAYMAKWFHPDLFEDLDPKAIHQEYLTRFQRLDYDLDEHGVFVYPPLE
jgi:iron complex transport system substrate-binding protein